MTKHSNVTKRYKEFVSQDLVRLFLLNMKKTENILFGWGLHSVTLTKVKIIQDEKNLTTVEHISDIQALHELHINSTLTSPQQPRVSNFLFTPCRAQEATLSLSWQRSCIPCSFWRLGRWWSWCILPRIHSSSTDFPSPTNSSLSFIRRTRRVATRGMGRSKRCSHWGNGILPVVDYRRPSSCLSSRGVAVNHLVRCVDVTFCIVVQHQRRLFSAVVLIRMVREASQQQVCLPAQS